MDKSAVAKPEVVDLDRRFSSLDPLLDRVPGDERQAATEGGPPWAATVTPYRDGGIFVVDYAGSSEWERHPDDEIVMVISGSTTMTMIIGGDDVALPMSAQQLVVVPAETWHRFDTPEGARILTVTPQPTDHSVVDPRD